MARTSSPRKTTPAKKTTAAAAKKTTAARKPATTRPRKTTTKKAAGTPRLSLVKPPTSLPRRPRDFMTDVQGFATLAARIAGITTDYITDWRDHSDGTATRPLTDGSTLHYTLETRTLRWQAICPMGAVHEYELTNPSTAVAARVHTDRCTTPHADLSTIQPLSRRELHDLGLHTGPTWARPDIAGDAITESIPVPLDTRRARALADELAHSNTGTADTQPLSTDQIREHIARQLADDDIAKEHPQP